MSEERNVKVFSSDNPEQPGLELVKVKTSKYTLNTFENMVHTKLNWPKDRPPLSLVWIKPSGSIVFLENDQLFRDFWCNAEVDEEGFVPLYTQENLEEETMEEESREEEESMDEETEAALIRLCGTMVETLAESNQLLKSLVERERVPSISECVEALSKICGGVDQKELLLEAVDFLTYDTAARQLFLALPEDVKMLYIMRKLGRA